MNYERYFSVKTKNLENSDSLVIIDPIKPIDSKGYYFDGFGKFSESMFELLESMINEGCKHFIISMKYIKVFSDLGPAFIAGQCDSLKKINGEIVFVEVNEGLLNILELLGFDHFINFYSDVNTALINYKLLE